MANKRSIETLFDDAVVGGIKRFKGNTEKTGHYHSGKEMYRMKVTVTHMLTDFFLIIVGIISAGFGLESFLLPNSFIDGGVTGISLLTAEVTDYPLPLLIVIINIPFIYIGFRQEGWPFAIKSILAISGLALAITFINYPLITSDKLLVAVFGGFFLGLGIGFTVRGNGVLDGTEILAIYLSKRTGLSIGDIILVVNIVIFSVAAYLLSIETALYSMLTYLVASKTVDFVLEGVEQYTGVTIVSPRSETIRIMIIEKIGRGVTIYNGQRASGNNGDNVHQIHILYAVMTRLEIAKLKEELDKIDPNAFIVMTPIKDARGGMIKKKPLVR